MKNHLIYIFLSFAMSAANAKNCNTLLRELADSQQLFIGCNTRHAVPANPESDRLCGACSFNYKTMIDNYDNLMKTENCSKIYIDSDRMNIVSTTQNVLKGLWERAYCDGCLEDNNLENFTQFSRNLSNCLEKHKRDECTGCLLFYKSMNDFYKNLDQKNSGKICFDMQDMMNRTRVLWSKDLKCCQRDVKMTIFLLSASVVAILPILMFYSVTYLLTKRRERNHGTLNENEPQLDAPSTSAIITAAVLSTPTETEDVFTERDRKMTKRLKVLGTSDSISDDST